MEEANVQYWQVHYISCEGNRRWMVVKAPADWGEEDVRYGVLRNSSYGDDPAEITECYYTAPDDIYTYDFTV